MPRQGATLRLFGATQEQDELSTSPPRFADESGELPGVSMVRIRLRTCFPAGDVYGVSTRTNSR